MKLLALLLAIATLVPARAAELKHPETASILDIFHVLCDHQIVFVEGSRADLIDPKNGAIVDTTNGYLDVRGDGAQLHYTLALFRRPDRSPVVAVTYMYDIQANEKIRLYAFDSKGRPEDITVQAWPLKIPPNDEKDYAPHFILPRYGRTITVLCQHMDTGAVSAHLGSFAWVKDRFIVEPQP